VLLRDGLNSQLDPELIARGSMGTCVSRRRESYYSAIGARGDLHSRLSRTNHLALPSDVAA